MPNSEVNSYFVPYAEQEGPHKVHYVFVPIEFPELPLDKEFKRQVTMPNLQRVTIDHQFGWGNEEDSRTDTIYCSQYACSSSRRWKLLFRRSYRLAN